MVIKLLGFGIITYFKDLYNVIDFLVILFTSVDVIFFILKFVTENEEQDITLFKALRSFRLIRLFKLAKHWKTLKYMIT